MMQIGNGYSITFNDGDYEQWTDEDKNLFFHLVNKAYQEFCEIKEAQKYGRQPWKNPNR